ncbi:DUF1820 family protein [Leucothrix sargassi]|nr:DUF1820 family protein [Leucothrix sargassi]
MNDSRLYKISFINRDKVYDIFAKQVYESDLYGFLAVEEIVFGNASEIVIDPSEEKLKAEFEGVKRSFIPLHSVVRIDEVKERGTCKITDYEESDNVAVFPSALDAGDSGK